MSAYRKTFIGSEWLAGGTRFEPRGTLLLACRAILIAYLLIIHVLLHRRVAVIDKVGGCMFFEKKVVESNDCLTLILLAPSLTRNSLTQSADDAPSSSSALVAYCERTSWRARLESRKGKN